MLAEGLWLARSRLNGTVAQVRRSFIAYLLIAILALTAYVAGVIAVMLLVAETEGMIVAATFVCAITALAAILVFVIFTIIDRRERRLRALRASHAASSMQASLMGGIGGLHPDLPRLVRESPIAATVTTAILAYALTKGAQARK